MFIRVLFLIMLPVIVYAQNTNIDDVEISQTNVEQGSFFDLLPVDETLATNEEPAFIRNLQNNDDTNITSTFIRAIIGFIFFFFILYLAYRYLKKRSKMILGTNNIINILATTPISQNKHLSIVEIADHLYFISVTDRSINLLSKIEDKDTKDIIRMAYSNSKNNIVDDSFSSIFDKALMTFNIKRKNTKSPLEATKDIKDKMKEMDNEVESYLDSEENIEKNTIEGTYNIKDSEAIPQQNPNLTTKKRIKKKSKDKN